MSKAFAVPQKQQAWLVTGRGKPRDVLVLSKEFDVPSKLLPGEVLVRVQAAALNPV